MKEAIQKAIKGGWKDDLMRANPGADTDGLIEDGHFDRNIAAILLDPLFWQALGKAEGWEKTQKICGCGCGGNNCHLRHCDENCAKYNLPIRSWKVEWHRFIDHVAEGKDIDSFFNELLK